MAMTDAQREILRKNHTFLLDNISNVVEVCDVLYEDGILSRENSDKINVLKSTHTEKELARLLLNILPTRGDAGFRKFISALIETNQLHVAERLDPSCGGATESTNGGDAVMPREHKEALGLCYTDLGNDLYQDSGLVAILYSRKVLNDREKQDIEGSGVEYKRNEKLVDILCRKSADDYKIFLNTLTETRQDHLRVMLEKASSSQVNLSSSSQVNLSSSSQVNLSTDSSSCCENGGTSSSQVNLSSSSQVNLSSSSQVNLSTDSSSCCENGGTSSSQVNLSSSSQVNLSSSSQVNLSSDSSSYCENGGRSFQEKLKEHCKQLHLDEPVFELTIPGGGGFSVKILMSYLFSSTKSDLSSNKGDAKEKAAKVAWEFFKPEQTLDSGKKFVSWLNEYCQDQKFLPCPEYKFEEIGNPVKFLSMVKVNKFVRTYNEVGSSACAAMESSASKLLRELEMLNISDSLECENVADATKVDRPEAWCEDSCVGVETNSPRDCEMNVNCKSSPYRGNPSNDYKNTKGYFQKKLEEHCEQLDLEKPSFELISSGEGGFSVDVRMSYWFSPNKSDISPSKGEANEKAAQVALEFFKAGQTVDSGKKFVSCLNEYCHKQKFMPIPKYEFEETGKPVKFLGKVKVNNFLRTYDHLITSESLAIDHAAYLLLKEVRALNSWTILVENAELTGVRRPYLIFKNSDDSKIQASVIVSHQFRRTDVFPTKKEAEKHAAQEALRSLLPGCDVPDLGKCKNLLQENYTENLPVYETVADSKGFRSSVTVKFSVEGEHSHSDEKSATLDVCGSALETIFSSILLAMNC